MIYELAGLRVNVKNRCRYTSEFCKEYLSEDQDSSADFEAETTKEEFYAEKEASPGFSDGYIENICLYRKICLQMPEYDRFLLHSAVLTFEGNAYAFLGRSGIGKSTHTALYTAHIKGSEILNGDKPIIARTGDEFITYGTPWNGKENRGRKGSAPLKGRTGNNKRDRAYFARRGGRQIVFADFIAHGTESGGKNAGTCRRYRYERTRVRIALQYGNGSGENVVFRFNGKIGGRLYEIKPRNVAAEQGIYRQRHAAAYEKTNCRG